MRQVGRDVVAAALSGGKTAALLDGRGVAGWERVGMLGGTTAALLDGRGDDDELLDGRRLHCWVGEIDDGCREMRSPRWEKAVRLVGRDVVAAAQSGGKTAALLDGRGAAGW